MTNGNTIGTAANKISLGGDRCGCSKSNPTPRPRIPAPGEPPFTSMPTRLRAPAGDPAALVDWNGWYANANPGPYYPCTTTVR
jgi:hypothetical protein